MKCSTKPDKRFVVIEEILLPGLVLFLSRFTKLLDKWSGSDGYCLQIRDGSWDSWTMPLFEQLIPELTVQEVLSNYFVISHN
ncbi:hypothetical protein K2173_002320 [Erythroxylum novogranatense]|uniref:Uncharacterized protein n=1 Tax=Erythroxylum novogranatense TaxID=1862640 RepID=A0AAV8T9C9_9ROSI|nr:hypothetical protein K2173_002320 [Erythroxylum novogranatense]